MTKETKKEAAKQRLEITKAAALDPASPSGVRLKSFIERVERLEEEKSAIAEDVKDVYGESKATGFDPAIIRKIVRMRKQSLEKRREEQELVELYCAAIGMSA